MSGEEAAGRNAGNPRVAIAVGSDSDLPTVKEAYQLLVDWGAECELLIVSAHRTPDEVTRFARSARERGLEVIISCAGAAAHLPGVIAAHTTVPVIGIPRQVGGLGGLDALLSIVQMPPGIPVACVGLDGARNAALLAASILATKYPAWADKLAAFRRRQAESVKEKNARLTQVGLTAYLEGGKGA